MHLATFQENWKKIDTSLFVQTLFLGTKYIETVIEENIHMKNHFRNKNLKNSISIRESASKNTVDNNFSDPSIIKNSEHIDLNHKKLNNVMFF